MTAYYNEFDPYAAQWLRNLIAAGHIAPGDVDDRSITDVKPEELAGYSQCHFFAGIGGWSLGARLAGWPDERPLWTGSCPCQPFSLAGKGEGQADERHLWPTFFALIRARRPDVVMGEQVAAAVGKDWLDGVHSDLESIGYASGAAVIPACAVDAPHRRDRLWFVADAEGERGDRGENPARPDGRAGIEAIGSAGALAHADLFSQSEGRQQRSGQFSGACRPQDACGRPVGDSIREGLEGQRRHGDDRDQPGRIVAQSPGPVAEAGSVRRNYSAWGAGWIVGADGKARRFEPGIRLLAHGVPARVGKLRAYGNAIVPQVAQEVIAAYMECRP